MSSLRRIGLAIGIAFVGWALCFALIGIGMSVTTVENALIVHAVGAPVIFAILSLAYFKRPNPSPPLITAVGFTAFVMTMDFFVVASLVLRSYSMFYSVLGTWIPFALIFLSTYFTGQYVRRQAKAR